MIRLRLRFGSGSGSGSGGLPPDGLTPWYPFVVDRTVSVFEGFDEAERADAAYYASLTPQQRVDLLLDMINQIPGVAG